MDIFKMTVDSVRHYPLTRELYTEMTGKEPPYFTVGEEGKMRHYAVCPACDNPTQIVGLVAQGSDGVFYAKHVPKSILGLATYRHSAYENCPLAAQNRMQVEKSARKEGGDDVSQKILTVLRDHFDRAVLVLQKSIGIAISQKLAESLLDDYLAEDGHCYKFSSLLNLPWMLAYMATSKSLVGRFIFDEDIKKAILSSVPQADFDGDKLIRKGKDFLQVNMYFSSHTLQPQEATVEESMRMVISVPGREKPKLIYEKKIVFDYSAFQYYLEIPEGKGFRKKALVDMAVDKLQAQA